MKRDFGKVAEDYARYRPSYPADFFERLQRVGIGTPGQRILDLGTGTGILARDFARRGCHVTGLDPSPALLEQARQLDRAAGVQVDYVTACAEQNGLPDHEFDVVTASMCWESLRQPHVTREVQRLLKPGGALVQACLRALVLPGSLVEATYRLIRSRYPNWTFAGDGGVNARGTRDTLQADFERTATFSVDVLIPFRHEAWCGRIRATQGIGTCLPPNEIYVLNSALQDMLRVDFPGDPLLVKHRAFATIRFRPCTNEHA